MDNIYRNIIEDSDILYTKIKLIRNEIGIYKGFFILDINKATDKFFSIREKGFLNVPIIDDSPYEEILEWNNIFEKTIKNGYYTVKKHNTNIKSFLSLHIYSSEKDVFHFKYSNVTNDAFRNTLFFEKFSVITWIKDLNGNYLDINDNFLTFFNREYSSLIGNNDEIIVSQEDANKLRQQDLEVMKTNKPNSYEDIFYVDNEMRGIKSLKWPYRDIITGEVLGTLGIAIEYDNEVKLKKSFFEKQHLEEQFAQKQYLCTDLMNDLNHLEDGFLNITNKIDFKKAFIRKDLLEEDFDKIQPFDVNLISDLSELENGFLKLINNVDQIILIQDGKKLLYTSANFENFYGITATKMGLYENINNWYTYWDSVDFYTDPKPSTYTGITTDLFKIKKEGFSEKIIWSSFVPILNENGEVLRKIGILSNLSNVSCFKEDASGLDIDSIANLSHEFRTPINLISSAFQILNSKLSNLDSKIDKDTSNFLNKYLNIISKNNLRLLKLVNDFIDTSKINSGKFTHSPKNVDIISCVENICMSVSEFVTSNNMSIIFDTDTEEKIVAFDQDSMERIMLNLLSNAIKFNKPGETIEVSISCKNNIKISVKDYGIGIPPDKLESIFGRFEQAKRHTKREKEGSGIGLSLIKSLIDMHKGHITVKSKLDEGSEFIVTLPDILVDDKLESYVSNNELANVNKMTVEFSDIYS